MAELSNKLYSIVIVVVIIAACILIMQAGCGHSVFNNIEVEEIRKVPPVIYIKKTPVTGKRCSSTYREYPLDESTEEYKNLSEWISKNASGWKYRKIPFTGSSISMYLPASELILFKDRALLVVFNDEMEVVKQLVKELSQDGEYLELWRSLDYLFGTLDGCPIYNSDINIDYDPPTLPLGIINTQELLD